METRELYQKKFEAQIHEWNAKLDLMKAQTEKLTAQAKLDVKPHLDSVRDKFDAAKARLVAISAATDDRLEELGREVDHGWSELKAAAEGAHAALRRHEKN
jgi:hypothetical protein